MSSKLLSNTDAPTHRFLWLDLETTGLNPHENIILEWALVLAEDDRDGTLEPVHEFSSVIHYDYSAPPKMDQFVRDMHTRNNLLSECIGSDTSLAESEEFLLAVVRDLTGQPNPKGLILAGNSVHFDLGFLRVHMPTFAACLSHRVFDVRTMLESERVWGDTEFQGEPAHRALPDVLRSLEDARAWKARRYQ